MASAEGHAEDVFAEAQLAHVPRDGNDRRTMVVITLTGGDDALREALGDRVIAAAREALTPPPQPFRDAVAAAFPTPQVEVAAPGAVLPPERAQPAASAYEAPFLLAPLHAGS